MIKIYVLVIWLLFLTGTIIIITIEADPLFKPIFICSLFSIPFAVIILSILYCFLSAKIKYQVRKENLRIKDTLQLRWVVGDDRRWMELHKDYLSG